MDTDFSDLPQDWKALLDPTPHLLLWLFILAVFAYWVITGRRGRFRGTAVLRTVGIILMIVGGLGLQNFAVGVGGLVVFLIGDVLARRKTPFERGVLLFNRKEFAKAIEPLTRAIAQEWEGPLALFYRGVAHRRLGNDEAAVADLTEALRRGVMPEVQTYAHRGIALLSCGKPAEAIADLTRAIDKGIGEIDQYYLWRARAHFTAGAYALAIDDFKACIRHKPDNAEANAFLAGMLSSAPDEALRDGPTAIRLAQHACDLTGWKDWLSLGALAAAYAEVGDFPEAVHRARQSVEFAPENLKAERQARLEEYLAGKPHRFPPKVEPSPAAQG